MSVNLLSSVLAALPSATFHTHGRGHRRGGLAESSTAGASAAGNASQIGDLPVGVSSALLGNQVHSLGQTAQASASSSAAAAQTLPNGRLQSLQGKAASASSALGNRVNLRV